MAEIAKIDSVYIPRVKSQDMVPEIISDDSRTASGKMMRDTVAVKRRWKLTASKLTPTERDAILNALAAKLYGAVAFWLDSFGAETETVQAHVTVEGCPRVPFGRGGTWYSDGCDMTLTITEQ